MKKQKKAMCNSISKTVLFLLIVCCVSCYSARDISTVNLASIYRESERLFHPEFVAYNKNDSTTIIYCKIKPSEFLFERQENNSFKSYMRIRIELIESFQMTRILDSSYADYSFDINEKPESKVLPVTIVSGKKGVLLLHVFIQDLNKGVQEDFFIDLDRYSKPSRQDFLISDENGVPFFRNYFYPREKISISYKDSTVKKFFCKYYNRNFALASPPYSFDVRSEFEYKPDSIFMLDVSERSLVFEKEGFYHIQTDTSLRDGYTLFRFEGSFPKITNPRQMIESVRYLTSKKEYEDMKNAASQKSMIDNFWLTHGGNEERSKLLIKKYYRRVEEANKYFTSYTEGWRTDRGMIYVIFGIPTSIYKSPESESWTYGTPNSSLSLNFFFIKVDNPFTGNDYTLSRSPSYQSNWYRAVETWRQGRAYNSFN